MRKGAEPCPQRSGESTPQLAGTRSRVATSFDVAPKRRPKAENHYPGAVRPTRCRSPRRTFEAAAALEARGPFVI